MRQDRDLLPWILGLGLLAAGAFGSVLLMPSPAAIIPGAATAAPQMPGPASSPAPVMPPQTPSFAALTPAAVKDGVAPAPLHGAIWQCDVNGHRIYADSPCGAGAFIRALNETNRMNPTPVIPSFVYPTYEPPYTAADSEELPSAPGNTVYVAHPVYWRRLPSRPARGFHPEVRRAPHAHRM